MSFVDRFLKNSHWINIKLLEVIVVGGVESHKHHSLVPNGAKYLDFEFHVFSFYSWMTSSINSHRAVRKCVDSFASLSDRFVDAYTMEEISRRTELFGAISRDFGRSPVYHIKVAQAILGFARESAFLGRISSTVLSETFVSDEEKGSEAMNMITNSLSLISSHKW